MAKKKTSGGGLNHAFYVFYDWPFRYFITLGLWYSYVVNATDVLMQAFFILSLPFTEKTQSLVFFLISGALKDRVEV